MKNTRNLYQKHRKKDTHFIIINLHLVFQKNVDTYPLEQT